MVTTKSFFHTSMSATRRHRLRHGLSVRAFKKLFKCVKLSYIHNHAWAAIKCVMVACAIQL